MIKVNVVLNNISWKKYLKNPNKFVAKKINLLNKNNKNYKKNIFIVSILLSGAKEINKINRKDFKKDFNKLWVHGLVHLFGYKHKKDQEFNKMNNIEKQYLRLIN